MNLQLCVIACSGAGGILSGVSHFFFVHFASFCQFLDTSSNHYANHYASIHVDLVVLVPACLPLSLSLASKVGRAEVPSCLRETLEMRDVSVRRR